MSSLCRLNLPFTLQQHMFYYLPRLTVSARQIPASCFFIKCSQWLKQLCPISCLVLLPSSSTDPTCLCLVEETSTLVFIHLYILPRCSYIAFYHDPRFFFADSYWQFNLWPLETRLFLLLICHLIPVHPHMWFSAPGKKSMSWRF